MGRRSPTNTWRNSRHTKFHEERNGDNCPRHIVHPCSWCSWSFSRSSWTFINPMNSHRRSTDQRRRQIAKTHKTMRKNMQKRDLNSKQPKTTINVGNGSKCSLRWQVNHHQPPTLFRWKNYKSNRKSKQRSKHKNIPVYQMWWWWCFENPRSRKTPNGEKVPSFSSKGE
jgi:hypothetical protein